MNYSDPQRNLKYIQSLQKQVANLQIENKELKVTLRRLVIFKGQEGQEAPAGEAKEVADLKEQNEKLQAELKTERHSNSELVTTESSYQAKIKELEAQLKKSADDAKATQSEIMGLTDHAAKLTAENKKLAAANKKLEAAAKKAKKEPANKGK